MTTSTLPGTHSSTTPNYGYQHTILPPSHQMNPSAMQLVPYGSINSIGSPALSAIYPNQLPAGSNLNLNKGPLTNDQLTKLYNMNSFGRGMPNNQYNQHGYQTASLPQSIRTTQHHQQIFNNQQYHSHITSYLQQTSQFNQTMTSSSSGNTQQPLLDKQFISSNNTMYSQQMNVTHAIQNQQQQETTSYSSSKSTEISLVPKVRCT